MAPVSSPVCTNVRSLTKEDFARLWEDYRGYVQELACSTLRRRSLAGPALRRVVRGAPAAALPSVGAVRGSFRDLDEDVVQDVAVAVLEHLTAGRYLGASREDERKFVSRTTVYCAWDAVYRAATVAFAAGEPAPEENPHAGEAVDRAFSAELRCAVAEVLDRLPEPERLALRLALEGYTHEEVADKLGRSVEASRALRYRAVLAAATLLADGPRTEERPLKRRGRRS